MGFIWTFDSRISHKINVMPGVGLMVGVVGLGSEGPEFKSCLAV